MPCPRLDACGADREASSEITAKGYSWSSTMSRQCSQLRFSNRNPLDRHVEPRASQIGRTKPCSLRRRACTTGRSPSARQACSWLSKTRHPYSRLSCRSSARSLIACRDQSEDLLLIRPDQNPHVKEHDGADSNPRLGCPNWRCIRPLPSTTWRSLERPAREPFQKRLRIKGRGRTSVRTYEQEIKSLLLYQLRTSPNDLPLRRRSFFRSAISRSRRLSPLRDRTPDYRRDRPVF